MLLWQKQTRFEVKSSYCFIQQAYFLLKGKAQYESVSSKKTLFKRGVNRTSGRRKAKYTITWGRISWQTVHQSIKVRNTDDKQNFLRQVGTVFPHHKRLVVWFLMVIGLNVHIRCCRSKAELTVWSLYCWNVIRETQRRLKAFGLTFLPVIGAFLWSLPEMWEKFHLCLFCYMPYGAQRTLVIFLD